MKLSDLQQWRERAARGLSTRGTQKEWRVVISMGTSGAAAGARDIMRSMMDEIERQELENVEVTLTGSLGLDDVEPVLRLDHAGESVVYGRLTTDAARAIVRDHIMHGRKVERFVIGLPKERE